MRQSLDAGCEKKNLKKSTKVTSSLPALNSLSQLPSSFDIPHIKENNALDSTLQNINNLFSPKKISTTFLEKSTFIKNKSHSKMESKVKEQPFTFGGNTSNIPVQTSISKITSKKSLSKIKQKYKSIEDFKPFADQIDPLQNIAKLKLQKRFLDKINHKIECEKIRKVKIQKCKAKIAPSISGRLSLDSLIFDNHNPGTITSKRNVGGGFQTSTESNIKNISNYYSLKQEEKRIREMKSINAKIWELKNFNLGLSSTDTASIKHISSRGSVIIPKIYKKKEIVNNFDNQFQIDNQLSTEQFVACSRCPPDNCTCVECKESIDTFEETKYNLKKNLNEYIVSSARDEVKLYRIWTGIMKVNDMKASEEIQRERNNISILRSKFSSYDKEISMFKNTVDNFSKEIDQFKESILKTNENMSSLVVNHKVEISQQMFRFRKDYFDIIATVNDNNEAMK